MAETKSALYVNLFLYCRQPAKQAAAGGNIILPGSLTAQK